jgi:hypothetical protein
VLDALAERLLEKEVIDRSELREIMGLPPAPDAGEEAPPGPDLPHREAAD